MADIASKQLNPSCAYRRFQSIRRPASEATSARRAASGCSRAGPGPLSVPPRACVCLRGRRGRGRGIIDVSTGLSRYRCPLPAIKTVRGVAGFEPKHPGESMPAPWKMRSLRRNATSPAQMKPLRERPSSWSWSLEAAGGEVMTVQWRGFDVWRRGGAWRGCGGARPGRAVPRA